MKNIILTESQFKKLIAETSLKGEYGEAYSSEISHEKDLMWDLIEYNGKLMVANDTDKVYGVYYLAALSKILGKDYVICRMHDFDSDKNYGSTYVKPLKLFREYVPGQFNPNYQNNYYAKQ